MDWTAGTPCIQDFHEVKVTGKDCQLATLASAKQWLINRLLNL